MCFSGSHHSGVFFALSLDRINDSIKDPLFFSVKTTNDVTHLNIIECGGTH